MNILFLLKSLGVGGVEIVTATLANKFVEEGHHICIYAFEKRSGMLIDYLHQDVEAYVAGKYQTSKKNVALLREIIKLHNIQVVINQWGLPLVPVKTVCLASKGINIKLITVYHSDPLKNGRIQNVESVIRNTKNNLMKNVFRIKRVIYRCITGYAMRYNYSKSDCYLVLSPSFISHFKQFIWVRSVPKLKVQANPLTIDSDSFMYQQDYKQNEIIYVGRIDNKVKRVDRVIEVWSHLEKLFPNWQLTIIGEGDDLINIKRMVRDLKLEHISLEGFQNPKPYYERASLLLLTSEFEGFGLVLTECMSFGVVPVVYGSYSAVYDIVEDGKNGIIVPQKTSGFNVALMAEKIQELMTDKTRLNEMAISAIEKSKHYSLDIIYQEWMKVIQ